MRGRKRCQHNRKKRLEKKKNGCIPVLDFTVNLNAKEQRRVELSVEKKNREENKLGLKQNRNLIREKRQERKFKNIVYYDLTKNQSCPKISCDVATFDCKLDDVVEFDSQKLPPIGEKTTTSASVVENSTNNQTEEVEWEVLVENEEKTASTSLPQPSIVTKPEHVYERVMKWFW
jgi:hypothetical protein